MALVMSAEPESSKLSEKEAIKHVCQENAPFPKENLYIYINFTSEN